MLALGEDDAGAVVFDFVGFSKGDLLVSSAVSGILAVTRVLLADEASFVVVE